MKELWEAITFLCFGFSLDVMFIKTNRTKTSILYLTQLTLYIDMCLTVTKHFTFRTGHWGRIMLQCGRGCLPISLYHAL